MNILVLSKLAFRNRSPFPTFVGGLGVLVDQIRCVLVGTKEKVFRLRIDAIHSLGFKGKIQQGVKVLSESLLLLMVFTQPHQYCALRS